MEVVFHLSLKRESLTRAFVITQTRYYKCCICVP